MSINQRVKEVRAALGLSQAKFAKEISVSNGYIAGIELGKRGVNDRLVKLICAAFQVREEWLREGKGEMFQPAPNALSQRMEGIFRELRPEFQAYVLDQIVRLLELQRAGARQRHWMDRPAPAPGNCMAMPPETAHGRFAYAFAQQKKHPPGALGQSS